MAKVSSAKKQVSSVFSMLKTQRLIRDRLFMTFGVAALLLALAIIVLLLVKVRPRDFLVPFGYSTSGSFDILGPWYQTYLYGVFALGVTAGNFGLALAAYEKSRLVSFLLIVGTLIINFFTLLVVNAVVTHIAI